MPALPKKPVPDPKAEGVSLFMPKFEFPTVNYPRYCEGLYTWPYVPPPIFVSAALDRYPRIELLVLVPEYVLYTYSSGNKLIEFKFKSAAAAPDYVRALNDILELLLNIGSPLASDDNAGLALNTGILFPYYII